MQRGYFPAKGLIYFSVLGALKKTPPFLLLERLTHNKFHKWQNSFPSLSFPLSSPLFSLPHPFLLSEEEEEEGEGERKKARGRVDV